ncbi:MAG: BamA/TamA family outer membrane protein [Flavobacteriales bacterium]|nr:BamA/TamA family outer membrane protein [Flavobacteriales bacterium]
MKSLYSGNKIYRILILGLMCAWSCTSGISQVNNGGDSLSMKALVYPLGYYSPETRLGLGLAGAINFRLNQDSVTPSSQIGFGFGYTQNDQYAIGIPFAYYSRHRRHSISGELSFNRFNYLYYGVGRDNEKGKQLTYDLQYDLFRINYLWQIKSHVFIGARWWYENDQSIDFREKLVVGDRVSGMNGGISSGPGLVFNFDNRDNIYFSRKGWYIELVAQDQSSIWGSDFMFNRYRFDLRQFTPIQRNLILASQLFGDFTTGDVPFGQLAMLGSGRRGRGYYMGRYRDHHILLYQGECRWLLNQKWGFTAHWMYALLSDRISDFSLRYDHAAMGFGMRYVFDDASGSTIRLDMALPIDRGVFIHEPDNALKFYFSVNEAF